MSRLDTMAERIKKDLPEFIELVPPSEESEGLYRRIRHIQMTNECCGFEMSLRQLKEIIEMASAETIKDPLRYLCRILDRLHIERTLKTIKNRMNKDKRVFDIIRYIKLENEWQIKYLSDLIAGKYSMNELMTACEIAQNKKQPDRYLLTLFKHGFRIKENG